MMLRIFFDSSELSDSEGTLNKASSRTSKTKNKRGGGRGRRNADRSTKKRGWLPFSKRRKGSGDGADANHNEQQEGQRRTIVIPVDHPDAALYGREAYDN